MWPAIIGGLLGLGGSIGGSMIEASSARDANRAAQQSTREQMEFQERMSSTAHQREVADLRAAGLNPILSANHGASSPAGSSYSPQSVYEGLTQNVTNSAYRGAEVGKEMALAKARVGTEIATQEKLKADKLVALQNEKLLEQEINSAKMANEVKGADLEFDVGPIGSTARQLGKVFNAISPIGAGVAGFGFGRNFGGALKGSAVRKYRLNPEKRYVKGDFGR